MASSIERPTLGRDHWRRGGECLRILAHSRAVSSYSSWVSQASGGACGVAIAAAEPSALPTTSRLTSRPSPPRRRSSPRVCSFYDTADHSLVLNRERTVIVLPISILAFLPSAPLARSERQAPVHAEPSSFHIERERTRCRGQAPPVHKPLLDRLRPHQRDSTVRVSPCISDTQHLDHGGLISPEPDHTGLSQVRRPRAHLPGHGRGPHTVRLRHARRGSSVVQPQLGAALAPRGSRPAVSPHDAWKCFRRGRSDPGARDQLARPPLAFGLIPRGRTTRGSPLADKLVASSDGSSPA